MKHKYDIILSARIEISGVYEAETGGQAVEMARLELRSAGEITDSAIERVVISDDEPMAAPEADTDYAARFTESQSET